MALATATTGDALCLGEGTWRGRISVPRGVTLWGTGASVVQTEGIGTTVELASNAKLLGLVVDGSGGRFDATDAAVRVRGNDAVVAGVTIRNAVFGIVAEKARRISVLGNHVVGLGGPALGLRGDGIRFWETHESEMAENRVEDARDCVVWYSTNNVIRNNDIVRGRYGVHMMYGHGNRAEENRLVENEVGIFLMYSRNVVVRRNTVARSGGTAGMGLGLKESGMVKIVSNHIVQNARGIFVDLSPMNPGDTIEFLRNRVWMSDVGVGFLSSPSHSAFRENSFHQNQTQVRVDGGGDARGATWEHNDWDDYAGYDLDRDGIGDIPYELRDLSELLEGRVSELSFLRGTPALGLVSIAGRALPLFQPRPILVDERPRMTSREIDVAD